MHSMKLLFTVHILIYITLSTATTDLFKSDTDRGYVRTKKKIYFKKPYRGNERLHTRQASNNFRHSLTVSPINEYPYKYTSENPRAAWKPITYTVVPEYRIKDVSSAAYDKIGNIDHGNTKRIPKEHIILLQTEHPHSQNVAPGNPPYSNYALLHYYIPFEHLSLAESKPIEEPLLEVPKKPIMIEHIVKATIEPIPIFTATTTTTTTPAPKTTPAPLINENTDSKNENFSGKYEYEYFVQDNHYGTNFGQKEYRDGKSTKGDYEVLLPDGRVQHVRYWSDASGYHATVTYHPLYEENGK